MSLFILPHQKYQVSPSLSQNWEKIENFKNKNVVLSIKNFPNISQNYPEYKYVQITEKFSYHFSSLERILRIMIGIILVILTLGLILIYTPIRYLFHKKHISIKTVLPYEKFPKELDQTKVQKAILSNIEAIKNKTNCKNVQHFSSCNYVFSLNEFPNWIFKIKFNDPKNKATPERFRYMLKLRNICKENNFQQLLIPKNYLMTINFEGNPLSIILEKKIDINNQSHIQEKIYKEHKQDYQLALQELTHLICQADLQDVNWEKCPLFFDNSTQTFSKIVILGAKPKPWIENDRGLFGWPPFKRGLIGCVSPEQFPIIKSIIIKYNKNIKRYEEVTQARLTELHRNKQLYNFYKEKNITLGNEPITLNPISLLENTDLNLNETYKGTTMREAFIETVQHINQKLTAIPDNPDSIQKARIISLDTAEDKLFKYHQSGFSPPTYNNKSTFNDKETWLAHIVHELIKKKALFDVISYTPYDFKVQA